MTTENSKDSKYVVMVCVIGVFLILASAITKFCLLDIVYLVFIAGCLIKYLYICYKHS